MMNEDLHEALPLWSLDRRGDGHRGTATTRGVVGVSSPLFVRPVPLGDPLGMVRYAPSRRAPERATTDHIAPLAMIRRILAAMRLPCGCRAAASVRGSNSRSSTTTCSRTSAWGERPLITHHRGRSCAGTGTEPRSERSGESR